MRKKINTEGFVEDVEDIEEGCEDSDVGLIGDDIGDDGVEKGVEKEVEKEAEEVETVTKAEKSKKKKKEEVTEEEFDDYDSYDEDDEDEDDEDEDERGRIKIIIVAIIIAAAIAAASIVTYNHLKTNRTEPELPVVEEEAKTDEENNDDSSEDEENEEDVDDIYDYESEDDDEEDDYYTPEPTATPKPLPTEVPDYEDDSYEENYEESYEDYDSTTVENDTQQTASTIFLGDLRFRSMANVVTSQGDSWECSSSGDYSWLTDTAFSDVENVVGEGTKVFINIGINDLYNSQAYASAINAKAAEWKEKGAKVYFVSVGPVAETSEISNQDICDFNTYMYQNLTIPFIDAYNYLVASGFETTDGQSYSDTTSMSIYNYIDSLVN